jgi:tetratricopeptide (TPR) repeat protein
MLILNSYTNTMQIQNRHLKLKPQWVEFITLSALKSLESNPTLTPAEIRSLGTWQNYSSDASVHAAISREHKKWEQHFEIPVLTGKFGKAFRLNPDLQPQFVQLLEEIKHKLVHTTHKPQRLENPDSESQSQLLLGQLYLERGHLEKAQSAFLAALAARPNTNLRCESIFWLARVEELLGLYEQAKRTTARILEEIKKQNPNNLDPRVKAWHAISLARIELRYDRWQLAKTLFNNAKKQLKPQHHRELGMVHNGLRRIAAHTSTLEEAQEHAEQTLRHYHQAHWTWGVQAALCDCGALYRKRAERIWENQNNHARKHLGQALRYFLLCTEICEAANTGNNSAMVEINLAWTYRKLEQLETAKNWIEKAIQIASNAKNQSDLAWAYMEKAELETLHGNRIGAAVHYN